MLLALLLIPTSTADTLSVGPEAVYSTIGDAIAAATGGDTIEVEPGTYAESVEFNGKAVTIRSTEGWESTIITGNGTVTVTALSEETRASQLIGFTVRGSGHTCIQTEASSPHFSELMIENCGDSSVSYGGGVSVSGGAPSFDYVVFSNNQAQSGGALHITDESEADLESCTFTNNSAESGGAAHITNSTVSFDDVAFDDNQSTLSNGGGIWAESGDITYIGGRLENNSATLGGGAIYLNGTRLQLVDIDSISGNTSAVSEGGALLVDGSDAVLISGSTFQNNNAWLLGGAISAHNVTDLYIEETELDGNGSNEESSGGGALALNQSILTLSSTMFSGNEASGVGGAVLAIDSEASVTASVFNLNEARAFGGAWYQYAGLVTVSNTEFERNAGTSGGGGLSVFETETQLTNVGFLWNESTGGNGGGLLFDGADLQLQDTRFQRNTAQYGGGLHATMTAQLLMHASVLQENEALFSAGGAFISGLSETSTTITNNDFVANETLSSGAVAQLTLTGSSAFNFTNNIVSGGRAGFGVDIQSSSAAPFTVAYNDVWSNEGGNYNGIADPTDTDGNISEDPLFGAFSADRDFDNDDLGILTDSPCLGAGDPDILTESGDRSNIGAFGVTEATVVDDDGDGFGAGSETDDDCDDSDPEVNPDAEEVCWDDIDNNCDGTIDEGCEEDSGIPVDTHEPEDTGDLPDTGTPEEPIDRDEDDLATDEDDAESPYEIDGSGCSCSHTTGGTSIFWISLLPLLLIRRGQHDE